jgi:hypothetical protein
MKIFTSIVIIGICIVYLIRHPEYFRYGPAGGKLIELERRIETLENSK